MILTGNECTVHYETSFSLVISVCLECKGKTGMLTINQPLKTQNNLLVTQK